MKKNIFIVAVIPAFNEEKKIGQVIREVSRYVNCIILIDDGSSDKTVQRAKYNRKVIIIQHALNLGQGAALQTGFEYAKQLNPDVIVTFDADGQFKASEIPRIIRPIIEKKADITLGSRFLGKTINMGFMKFVLLKTAILFTYIFSSIKLTDTHNGFRAFNKKTLQKITLTHNGMAHASEIIDQIKINKLKYKEMPVTVTYNTYSKKKGQRHFNAFNIVFNLIFSKLH